MGFSHLLPVYMILSKNRVFMCFVVRRQIQGSTWSILTPKSLRPSQLLLDRRAHECQSW